MTDPRGPQEPSMEEILASIRRVIAEDGSPPDVAESAAPAPAAAAPAPPPGGDNDVLLLTEEVGPEAPGPQETVTPPATNMEGQAVPPASDTTPELISQDAAAASAGALSELARSVMRTREAPMGGGRTIEDLVRETLAPMLKEWLDANLALLVERLVRKEIERLSRRAEDDL